MKSTMGELRSRRFCLSPATSVSSLPRDPIWSYWPYQPQKWYQTLPRPATNRYGIDYQIQVYVNTGLSRGQHIIRWNENAGTSFQPAGAGITSGSPRVLDWIRIRSCCTWECQFGNGAGNDWTKITICASLTGLDGRSRQKSLLPHKRAPIILPPIIFLILMGGISGKKHNVTHQSHLG